MLGKTRSARGRSLLQIKSRGQVEIQNLIILILIEHGAGLEQRVGEIGQQ